MRGKRLQDSKQKMSGPVCQNSHTVLEAVNPRSLSLEQRFTKWLRQQFLHQPWEVSTDQRRSEELKYTQDSHMQSRATSSSRASRATHLICPSLEGSMTTPGHVAGTARSSGILGKRGCQRQLQGQSQDLRVSPPLSLGNRTFFLPG